VLPILAVAGAKSVVPLCPFAWAPPGPEPAGKALRCAAGGVGPASAVVNG